MIVSYQLYLKLSTLILLTHDINFLIHATPHSNDHLVIELVFLVKIVEMTRNRGSVYIEFFGEKFKIVKANTLFLFSSYIIFDSF